MVRPESLNMYVTRWSAPVGVVAVVDVVGGAEPGVVPVVLVVVDGVAAAGSDGVAGVLEVDVDGLAATQWGSLPLLRVN